MHTRGDHALDNRLRCLARPTHRRCDHLDIGKYYFKGNYPHKKGRCLCVLMSACVAREYACVNVAYGLGFTRDRSMSTRCTASVRASERGFRQHCTLDQTLYEPCRQRVRFPSFRACPVSAVSCSLGDEKRVTRQTRQTSGSRGGITCRHLTVAGPHAASKAIRSVHPEHRNSRWRASAAPAPALHCSGSARAARRAPSSRPRRVGASSCLGPRHSKIIYFSGVVTFPFWLRVHPESDLGAVVKFKSLFLVTV
jgi:hypothetical protein